MAKAKKIIAEKFSDLIDGWFPEDLDGKILAAGESAARQNAYIEALVLLVQVVKIKVVRASLKAYVLSRWHSNGISRGSKEEGEWSKKTLDQFRQLLNDLALRYERDFFRLAYTIGGISEKDYRSLNKILSDRNCIIHDPLCKLNQKVVIDRLTEVIKEIDQYLVQCFD